MHIVDLRSCLESWPYDAETNVRIGRGADGREIILVRQPMGLEQYEVDGRPDGRRVRGEETVLSFHRSRVDAAKKAQRTMTFELSTEDCAEIFNEATAFYHRLVFLFRLKDWARVGRDAAQLLSLLEFARQHARCAEDRVQLEPWRPRITRVHAVARVMVLLDQKQYRDALETARDTLGFAVGTAEGLPNPQKLAEALLESVRGSLTTRPLFPPHEEASFLRQADYWAIRYHGQTAFLKSTRGLQCLAFLLRAPGCEFHVSEMLGRLSEASAARSASASNGRLRDNGEHPASRLDAGLPILDTRAKDDFRSRLTELRQEIAEAERFADFVRAANAHEETHAIAQHLASAIGLGGRDRKASSEAERARCTVTKRLKQAIQRIAVTIPTLGHHLAARIKTGYFCSYSPHPDRQVAWKL